jgi:hypothetical protein
MAYNHQKPTLPAERAATGRSMKAAVLLLIEWLSKKDAPQSVTNCTNNQASEKQEL